MISINSSVIEHTKHATHFALRCDRNPLKLSSRGLLFTGFEFEGCDVFALAVALLDLPTAAVWEQCRQP